MCYLYQAGDGFDFLDRTDLTDEDLDTLAEADDYMEDSSEDWEEQDFDAIPDQGERDALDEYLESLIDKDSSEQEEADRLEQEYEDQDFVEDEF